jgi:hypothetical protein
MSVRTVPCVITVMLSLLQAKGGTLSGSFASVAQASVVDLSAEGKIDWVHWGLFTESSLNRKAGVPQLIGDFILQDASNGFAYVYQYADNFNGYTWYDGWPETAVTNTTTGVWAYGVPDIASGFQFTVPADTTVRTLKVYVGTYGAQGHFEATLSDGSALAYSNSSLINRMGNGPGAVYTLTYAADSANQTLRIRWTLLLGFRGDANVTLQAAALSEPGANNPPIISLVEPAENAKFAAGSGIMLSANATDLDGSVAKVEFFDGSTLVGESASNPFSINWNGANVGHHIVSARATDDQNASRTSAPVDVFVHSSGGTLSGSMAFPPSFVDLTSAGTADWIHLGLTSTNDLNRKADVVPQFSAPVWLGNHFPQRFSNYYSGFGWSDGTPVPSEASTPTGLFITGVTNGFRITAPADETPRQLNVYVSLYGEAGNFQAFLSDGSAPAYTDTSLDNVFGDSYAVYTLDYSAASAAQTLIVEYRSSRVYDMDYGNVAFPAATLNRASLPPPLRILNPHIESASYVFSFPTESGKSYTVQRAAELPSASWQTVETITGDGNTATISDPMTAGQAFYRVRVP